MFPKFITNNLSTSSQEFIKFLFIGGVNTLFGYTIYVLFIIIGLNISLSLGLATLMGAFFNYLTTGKFVFNNSGFKKIILFIPAYFIIYIINLIALKFMLYLGFSPIIAQFLMLVPISIFSFLLIKYGVFQLNHKK